jgi:hypothetical protein
MANPEPHRPSDHLSETIHYFGNPDQGYAEIWTEKSGFLKQWLTLHYRYFYEIVLNGETGGSYLVNAPDEKSAQNFAAQYVGKRAAFVVRPFVFGYNNPGHITTCCLLPPHLRKECSFGADFYPMVPTELASFLRHESRNQGAALTIKKPVPRPV